jgi:hypothetical protein
MIHECGWRAFGERVGEMYHRESPARMMVDV